MGNVTTTNDYSPALTAGARAKTSVSGENSIAVAVGANSAARAATGYVVQTQPYGGVCRSRGGMMRVRTQGSIGVSPAGATVIDKTDRIAYISVDLADKWPYILHYSRAGFDEHWPVITLGDSEDDRNPTKLEFPEFTGWTAHLVDVSKYTLMVLLVNEDY